MILQAAARPALLQKVGNAAQGALSAFGTAKGLYDLGSTIASGVRAAAPYVRAAAAFI